MTTYVRDAGTWKQLENIYVKDAGTWKQVKEAYVRNGGSWQRVHLRVLDLTISSNVANYNVCAAARAANWDGIDVLTANVIINAGVVVSGSPSGTAITTGPSAAWPAASDIQIHNFGTIVGQGGAGGDGGVANRNTTNPTRQPGFPGTAGGTAMLIQKTTTIHNHGIIGGGGGGGAGGTGYATTNPARAYGGGGGGGGRTGFFTSLGGAGGLAYDGDNVPGTPGANGTLAAAGSGGEAYSPPLGNPGGVGGNWGAAGFPAGGSGGDPGAAGRYIDGIVNVTIANTGTLLGTTT